MADYKDKMMAAVKEAMKSKDKERRDVIRQLQAAIKQVEIDKRTQLSKKGKLEAGQEVVLSTEEEMEVLIKETKKLRESIDELTKAGREATDEERELVIVESFLPEQMSEEEIRELVTKAIAETGASEIRDMGKVMGKLSPQTKGKADGKLVSTIVREILNS